MIKLFSHLAREAASGSLFSAPVFSLLETGTVSLVVRDWVIGLSMRSYVERHFDREFEMDHRARGSSGTDQRDSGSLSAAGVASGGARRGEKRPCEPVVSMRGDMDRGSSGERPGARGYAPHTRSSITIRIEEFHPGELRSLRKMLARLHRYRDRIVIAADENSRRIIDIDSSVFNLALDV